MQDIQGLNIIMRKVDFKEYVFKPEQILTSFEQPTSETYTTGSGVGDEALLNGENTANSATPPKPNIEGQLQNWMKYHSGNLWR